MTIGIRPSAGFSLIDGQWARELSNGNNDTGINGITAHSGGTQAAALALSNNFSLYEVDTVAADNDSVSLPFAAIGERKMVFNNGAHTLAIYASPNTNPLTGSTDVINKTVNTQSYTITTGQTVIFFCAKNGVWAANKTA